LPFRLCGAVSGGFQDWGRTFRWRRPGGCPYDALNRRNETVAAARERLDVTRGLRIVTKGGPDPPDAKVQPLLEIHKCLGTPDLPLNLFSSDQLSNIAGQQDKNPERLRWQRDERTGFAKFTRFEV
jgi:hypothetical protein